VIRATAAATDSRVRGESAAATLLTLVVLPALRASGADRDRVRAHSERCVRNQQHTATATATRGDAVRLAAAWSTAASDEKRLERHGG
jgi:hypothetical protein